MVSEIGLGRQQIHERVAVRKLLAVEEVAHTPKLRGGCTAREIAVVPELGGERRMVHHVRRARVTLDEIGDLPVAKVAGNAKGVRLGHHFCAAGEPAAPAVGLQKFIDAVLKRRTLIRGPL
jgi:hypothetical protein